MLYKIEIDNQTDSSLVVEKASLHSIIKRLKPYSVLKIMAVEAIKGLEISTTIVEDLTNERIIKGFEKNNFNYHLILNQVILTNGYGEELFDFRDVERLINAMREDDVLNICILNNNE